LSTSSSSPLPYLQPGTTPQTVTPGAAVAPPADVPDFAGDEDHTLDEAHGHAGHAPAPISLSTRISNFLGVTIPFAGLVTAIVLLWGPGFHWLYLWLLLGMYLLTVTGIGVGFHRLLTHRAFETPRAVKYVLTVLGSMAMEARPIKWVAIHRSHHHHSDGDADPHSPHHHGAGFVGMLKGFWHAHLGWVFQPDRAHIDRYVADLKADRGLVRVDKLFALWVALGLLLPAAIAFLVTGTWNGALLGFIWGGVARIFLVHHVTFSINSVCHIWGTREFRSDDHSTNNLIFGVLALGEGWHNNHHAFPTSARHGLHWWQIDASYYVIRALALVGLARKVRLPSPQSLEAKRRTTAATA